MASIGRASTQQLARLPKFNTLQKGSDPQTPPIGAVPKTIRCARELARKRPGFLAAPGITGISGTSARGRSIVLKLKLRLLSSTATNLMSVSSLRGCQNEELCGRYNSNSLEFAQWEQVAAITAYQMCGPGPPLQFPEPYRRRGQPHDHLEVALRLTRARMNKRGSTDGVQCLTWTE